MAEEAVVVEGHLGVERDQAAVAGEYARIDFEHGGVRIHERAIERLKERRRAIGSFAGEAEAEGQLARLIGLQAERWMDGFAQNWRQDLFLATSSISMPPAALAMKTTWPVRGRPAG